MLALIDEAAADEKIGWSTGEANTSGMKTVLGSRRLAAVGSALKKFTGGTRK